MKQTISTQSADRPAAIIRVDLQQCQVMKHNWWSKPPDDFVDVSRSRREFRYSWRGVTQPLSLHFAASRSVYRLFQVRMEPGPAVHPRQVLQALGIPRLIDNDHTKRLQLRPRLRLSLSLGISELLHADQRLVNPLREGRLVCLLFRLVYAVAMLAAGLISQSASSSTVSTDAPCRSMRRAYERRANRAGVVRRCCYR